MIQITVSEPDGKKWKNWCDKCANATTTDINAHNAGMQVTIDEKLYRLQKDFFKSPKGPFRGKCAYCESNLTAQHGDIEHYRPKKTPLHEDWTPVKINNVDQVIDHPGYFWLAYNWRNLVPSCQLCNMRSRGGKYGKSNRFPVVGEHATQPGGEVREHPKLLHPCIDNPAEHIRVHLTTGILIPLSERGRATIDILGLNERDLPDHRRRRMTQIEEKFLVALSELKGTGMGLADAVSQLKSDCEMYDYTASSRLMLRSKSEMLGRIQQDLEQRDPEVEEVL